MKPTKTSTLFPLAVLCSVLLLGVIGCSKTGTITGKVKYNGEPVAIGVIQFIPEKGKAVSANIADGEYKAERVPVGPCVVTVSTAEAERTARSLPKEQGAGPTVMPNQQGGTKAAPDIQGKAKDKPQTPALPGGDQLKQNAGEKDLYKRLKPVPAKFGDPEEAKKNPKQNITVEAGKQEVNLDLEGETTGPKKTK